MLKWLIKWRLGAFERKFGYDASYVRHVLDTDLGAFLRFARLEGLAWHRDVPLELYYGAKLTAVAAEDCGPCTQLNVAMALRERVDPRMIAAILEGTEAMMSEPAALGVRFARAVEARDPVADELRATIRERWGERAVISIGFALVAARVFPTLKYALGYGKACTRIDVAGEVVTPRHVLRAAS